MYLTLVPLHKYPEYFMDCCHLINSEWKRSDTARLRSLEASCDNLPTSLVLLLNNDEKLKVIGYLRLSVIPSVKEACFVESVVIDKELRGKGYGTILMQKSEEYCRDFLKLNIIYLSTKGQEYFYSKLGYSNCLPISIYGNYKPEIIAPHNKSKDHQTNIANTDAPLPPPLPDFRTTNNIVKTFMKKEL